MTPAGLAVSLSGNTVRPFSDLAGKSAPKGAVFGARDGLLTVTAAQSLAGGSGGAAVPITVVSRPSIAGSALTILPERMELLGTTFPASAVARDVKSFKPTVTPLQALPSGLHYAGVEVAPQGLRLTISGRDVTLGGNSLTGAPTCPART
jgi:hypothetical protein